MRVTTTSNVSALSFVSMPFTVTNPFRPTTFWPCESSSPEYAKTQVYSLRRLYHPGGLELEVLAA